MEGSLEEGRKSIEWSTCVMYVLPVYHPLRRRERNRRKGKRKDEGKKRRKETKAKGVSDCNEDSFTSMFYSLFPSNFRIPESGLKKERVKSGTLLFY